MKKIVLLILLIPALCQAQIQDTSFQQVNERLRKASIEMIKFDKQFRSGIMLEIIGGVIIGAGSVGSSTTNKQPIIIVGSIIGLFGFIMNISSSTHIKNAGLILRGNKVVIPLKRK